MARKEKEVKTNCHTVTLSRLVVFPAPLPRCRRADNFFIANSFTPVAPCRLPLFRHAVWRNYGTLYNVIAAHYAA